MSACQSEKWNSRGAKTPFQKSRDFKAKARLCTLVKNVVDGTEANLSVRNRAGFCSFVA